MENETYEKGGRAKELIDQFFEAKALNTDHTKEIEELR